MSKILLNTGPSERGWQEIALSAGRFTKVDNEDAPFLNRWKWSWGKPGAHRKAHKGEEGYRSNRDCDTILMHRVIMKAPKGVQVDHINGDRLDNRRSNLRLANQQQNSANMRRRANNKVGVKGVVWDKARRKWAAFIKVNYKSIGLGRFDTKAEAANAYAVAAKKHFGTFARVDERR